MGELMGRYCGGGRREGFDLLSQNKETGVERAGVPRRLYCGGGSGVRVP